MTRQTMPLVRQLPVRAAEESNSSTLRQWGLNNIRAHMW
ncbi:hypothetical protein Arno18_71 [Pectobacterium phage Arno18]|uniref:Uncharacterized protein n=1 Tax=Pectobacterium phage Arno18 TaxID=2500578 RepID=A0A678ZZH2_9CAUD|nr:hypothetical protein Arno18_71 [Pectobacterium phage Arno18]